MPHRRAVVIAAADARHFASIDTETMRTSADMVVAADGGVDLARALGFDVDVVVGDLDSGTNEALEWAREQGAQVVAFPADKNETDLELALDHASGRVDHLEVLLGPDGRSDHAMANLIVLASSRWRDVTIRAWLADTRVHVVRGALHLDADVGTTVSVLAVGGPATGVTTWGLRYPLHDETLEPSVARGISNEVMDERCGIEIAGGVALVFILPEH